TILDNITMSLNAGEAVAVVGPSGSGKSTLLSLLAGLDEPSDGEIHLLDQPLHSLDEDGRAAVRADRVGFVFQSFQLLPGLTALENVMLPLELTAQADARGQASTQLQQVGLEDRLKHLPSQLSGGEQQRVALARAFVTRPKILFADEPTGNLDRATGDAVVELMFTMRTQYECALVLVTHDQRLAERCDRVLTMQEGQLA
ncbi:MAG: ABC transporter ATP-binding protein, partial [Pseudomonadota bacterium]